VEFLAPELLFSKFQDHTSAIDVWGFGMVLYCVLFGKKPKSFYAVYRDWYKKTHNRDVGMGTIPFVPPSTKNFIYDPFAFDFENPFDAHSASEDPDLGAEVMKQLKGLAEAAEADADMKNEKLGDGMFDFSNFMKCISKLSYSALFSDDSSKFNCKNLSYLADKAQENSVPRFAGQEVSNNQSRMQTYMSLAQ
jgi:serine/threonine protein kinase